MELLRKELAKKAGAQQKLHAGSATSSNTSSSARFAQSDCCVYPAKQRCFGFPCLFSLPAAGAPKRFLKRGEIEQLRVEQELAEKRAREERKQAAEAEASQRFSKPAAAEVVAPVLVDLPLDEVIRRLRKLRKPIT